MESKLQEQQQAGLPATDPLDKEELHLSQKENSAALESPEGAECRSAAAFPSQACSPTTHPPNTAPYLPLAPSANTPHKLLFRPLLKRSATSHERPAIPMVIANPLVTSYTTSTYAGQQASPQATPPPSSQTLTPNGSTSSAPASPQHRYRPKDCATPSRPMNNPKSKARVQKNYPQKKLAFGSFLRCTAPLYTNTHTQSSRFLPSTSGTAIPLRRSKTVDEFLDEIEPEIWQRIQEARRVQEGEERVAE